MDYIECIPIGETRNYVMRVLENVQVYRARLNGGHAPLKLVTDLKRGGYGQIASAYQTARNTLTPALAPTRTDTPVDVVASATAPNPPEEAVIERTALERGTIRHVKTQAELARREGAAHKIKAKGRGVRHGKAKRRRS